MRRLLNIGACNGPSASDGLVLTRHPGPVRPRLRTTDCIFLSNSVCRSHFWLVAGVQFSGFCPWQKIKSGDNVLLEVQETVVGLECALQHQIEAT